MSIHALVDSDTTKILDYAVGSPTASIGDWKAKLHLLGVCKLWTQIARPLVYHTVFIRQSTTRRSGQAVKRWETNSDCVAIRRCWNLPKRLNIHISECKDVQSLVARLEKSLCLSAVEWSGVRTLELDVTMALTTKQPASVDTSSSVLSEFGERFAASVPGVLQIDIRHASSRGHVNALLPALMGVYALRLRALTMTPLVTLDINRVPYFGSQLTKLHVAVDHTDTLELPRVFANALQRLELENVPVGFTWTLFSNTLPSGNTCFARLQELAVSYAESDGSDTELVEGVCVPQLHFPEMQRVSVSNPPAHCSILSARYCAGVLKRVRVNSGLAIVAEHAEVWTTAKVVEMRIDYKLHEPASVEAANNIYAVNRGYRRSRLHIWELSRKLHTPSVNWLYLNELVLQRTDLETILKLLPELPRLTLLKIGLVRFRELSPDAQLVDRLFGQYLRKGSVNMREFGLNDRHTSVPDHVIARVVYNVVGYMDVLERLVVRSELGAHVRALVDELGRDTPRVKRIRLSVYT
ncbi:hypothetical protein H4S02_001812 [Coemansia sp. RSA 2611]|nr:hypothetical protein H4S01_000688 [Coemansia sp. RSA 2610]KAJ2390524.1 hypothetical protein H4S02_001812 [Coemansia sp. RSA 2611]